LWERRHLLLGPNLRRSDGHVRRSSTRPAGVRRRGRPMCERRDMLQRSVRERHVHIRLPSRGHLHPARRTLLVLPAVLHGCAVRSRCGRSTSMRRMPAGWLTVLWRGRHDLLCRHELCPRRCLRQLSVSRGTAAADVHRAARGRGELFERRPVLLGNMSRWDLCPWRPVHVYPVRQRVPVQRAVLWGHALRPRSRCGSPEVHLHSGWRTVLRPR
jgi:hypothetical protein